ncbi:MAG: ankyrin repeat domain-containing protein [Planctomycetales bacterium]|nr:ankyrin repeat domain-containing protein [Planctomycetales bacterium]
MLDADPRLVNKPFVSGELPVYRAAIGGRADVVSLLLDRGANPNAAGSLGTPLHVAATKNDLHTGRVLLQHGADPSIPGLLGITVREVCESAGNRDFLYMLNEFANENAD